MFLACGFVVLWIGWFLLGTVPVYHTAPVKTEGDRIYIILPPSDTLAAGNTSRIQADGTTFDAQIAAVSPQPDGRVRIDLVVPSDTHIAADARASIEVDRISPAALLLRIILSEYP
jgi:hypothetical protein